ncbi:hypothetical protein RGU70_02680 [Herbaspirillum sp. RTI4]|uniref:hypothetical protein n=1 Tax=Herbaspirillum sp. RTI4 TaxID=3048640 RepID=UPI002AB41230|nr:hypothetical protein [Herbaspirillum sp. RTI4]MDY7577234.1 hypothetical protein [Herbaspirillum sp. RTI4]MEA9980524.1 hypothetical protein [Herbaspirillum sp. RTI4]
MKQQQAITKESNTMFLTNLAFPMEAIEAAAPFAQTVAGATIALVRPVLGVGALATLLVVFKPLVAGVLRALLVLFKPRQSLAERREKHRFEGLRIMNRMANHYNNSQPGLAAELRAIAARD